MAVTEKVGKERIAKCSYCDRPFSKLEHAQRHERTHTRDRPFACDTCGKDFARQDTLNRHKKLHARGEGDVSSNKGNRGRKRKLSDAGKPTTASSKASKSKKDRAATPALDEHSPFHDTDPSAAILALSQTRRLSDSHLAPAFSPPPQPHSRRHTIANPPPQQQDASYASLLGLQLDMQPSDLAHLERSFTEPSPLEEFLSAASSMSYTEDDDVPSRSHSACSYSGTFESNSGEVVASPSFSSLSPAEELEAILANDPLQSRRMHAHAKELDFHTLAGAIEGASPAPSGVQPHSTLFEDLLGIVAKESEVALRQTTEEPQVPPSTSAAGPAFRTDFDFIGEPAPFLTPQVSTTAELYPIPPPAHTRRASFTALHHTASSSTTKTSPTMSHAKASRIPAITMPSNAASIRAAASIDYLGGGPSQPTAQRTSPPVNPSGKAASPALYIPTLNEQLASASPMWQSLLPASSGMDSPSSSSSFVRV